MSIKYFIEPYKDSLRGGDNTLRYRGRLVQKSPVSTSRVAQLISVRSKLEAHDVLYALHTLSVVMTDLLAHGYPVKLDGIGLFKIGLRTTSVENIEDFDAKKHVKSLRVTFYSERLMKNTVSSLKMIRVKTPSPEQLKKLETLDELEPVEEFEPIIIEELEPVEDFVPIEEIIVEDL